MIGIVIWAYMFAIPFSCLFELPILTLEKVLFHPPKIDPKPTGKNGAAPANGLEEPTGKNGVAPANGLEEPAASVQQ